VRYVLCRVRPRPVGVLGSYDEPVVALTALDLARERFAGHDPGGRPVAQRLVLIGPDGTVLASSDYRPAAETTPPAVTGSP